MYGNVSNSEISLGGGGELPHKKDQILVENFEKNTYLVCRTKILFLGVV